METKHIVSYHLLVTDWNNIFLSVNQMYAFITNGNMNLILNDKKCKTGNNISYCHDWMGSLYMYLQFTSIAGGEVIKISYCLSRNIKI
jgi:hypothetical protein